jgi:eukaryotic-like serine/threonine-protein kinase
MDDHIQPSAALRRPANPLQHRVNVTDSIRDSLATALGSGYTIGRELGGGGMSRVWIAHDETLGRDVVVKLLSPDLAQELSTERFTREVRLSAGLQHAHIVPLLSAGVTSDNRPYYLMPFVEGESLRARLDRHSPPQGQPIADVVSVLRDVCRALSYAHARGVVHRDIKPDNILVSSGTAVVADFGIAKAMTSARASDTQTSAALTRMGTAIGSPAYMSPEQGSGDPETDHRTDIYAVGITAYELLTGTPPFTQSTTSGLLMAHFTEAPADVRQRRADVPEGLAALVMRCLAKNPDDRPQSAELLATALGESVMTSGAIAAATRPTVTPSAVAPAAKRRALLLGGGVAALAIAVGAFTYLRRPSGIEAGLVAVMPFTVRDSSVQLWREGLVDVLSRSLDGAGTLRTVAASTTIAQSPARADAAAAEKLGRSVGAGLVLFGDVGLEGRDSVHIRYAVYDVAAARTRYNFDLRGERSRMDALADSMALRVLREIGSGAGGAALTSVGTRSVPAMRAFLQGQQFYRRGVVDSARNAYQLALESDSTFALAWRGVASVYIRQGREDEPDAVRALDMAIRYKSGRSPRDSMLLRADSLRLAFRRRTPGATDAVDAIAVLPPLFATLERATQAYPSDAELWFERGDAAYHFGEFGDVSHADAATWFSRGVALDSTFVVPQYHLFDLAIRAGNTTEAARSARRMADLSTGDAATYYALLAKVLETQPVSASARKQLDSLPLQYAGALLRSLASMPDTGGVALQLAQNFVTRPLPQLAAAPDSAGFRDAMALVFASRGRGHEAMKWSTNPGLLLQLARNGIGSLDSALIRTRQLLAQDPRQAVGASRLFAEQRDTASLRRLSVWADSVDKASMQANGKATPGAAVTLPGFRLLAAGDTAAAINAFLAIPMTACSNAPCAASTVAALLVKRGRLADAARVLDRWLPSATLRTDVPLDWLTRARIAEQTGDVTRAAVFYRRVATVWSGADAELRASVSEATAGMGRVSRK